MQNILRDLRSRTGFEARGEALLDGCSSFVREVLSRSEYPNALLWSGEVHLRASDGYRALAQRRFEARATHPDEASEVGSASIWRWMRQKERPLGLDIHLRQLHVAEEPDEAPLSLDDDGEQDLSASLQRVFNGEATHLLLLPLRATGGSLEGMATLTFVCPEAMGTGFVWAELAEALELLVEVATPYLLTGPAPALAPSVRASSDPLLPVVGATMAERIAVAERFAKSEEMMLISGPSGAGKSRLAKWCHARSRRADGPFEALDLLSVPEDMQKAQLFGWERGAFTGAVQETPGALSRVEGGTLFIDEIDKLSLDTQAALLKVLEDGTFQRLGSGSGERRANVRFLIGTNADLEASMRSGSFREDLFWRIYVLLIHLPPLAERRDEIVPWAQFMLQRCAPKSQVSWEQAALDLLVDLPWPGNLRQLDNVIRRTYAMSFEPDAASIVVTLDALQMALSLQQGPAAGTDTGIRHAFQRAASLFARQAVALHRERGVPVDLALTEGVRGLVLREVSRELGDLAEAYRLFGRDSLVENRNHHRAFAREREILEGLTELDPSFSSLLEESEF